MAAWMRCVTRATVVGAQHLHDAVAEVVARGAAKARLAEQVAACRAQLFVEGRGDPRAPVAFGHEHHAAAAAAGADVARDRARIIFR